jgi:putative flippase GtrA
VTSGADPRRTLLRFVIVGGTLAATSQLTFPKAVSSGCAWILCIPIGFWAHRRFTFVARRPRRNALWYYAGTQILGVAIAAIIGQLFARGEFWPDLPVHLSASVLSAIASYLINSTLVFRADPAD